MHKALNPGDCTNRFYVTRKEGGRRLVNYDDCVVTTIQGLEEYTTTNNNDKNYYSL